MAFNKVKLSQLEHADRAIDAATSGEYYERFDYADLVAAGAGVVLERGAPRLTTADNDKTAEEMLGADMKSRAPMLMAVGRYIDAFENKPGEVDGVGDGVRTVVADVLQQVSAGKIISGLENNDFSNLNDTQKVMAEVSSYDAKLRMDFEKISEGHFYKVSEDMGEVLEGALSASMTGELAPAMSMVRVAVDNIYDRSEAMDEQVASAEGGLNKFVQISDESLKSVVDFHTGQVSTGVPQIDSAMVLLLKQGKVNSLALDDPMTIAQARLLEERSTLQSSAPSDLASMAITDAKIMTLARSKNEPQMESIGSGRYDRLHEGLQEDIQKRIIFGHMTPVIDKVRLEVDMMESNGIAGIVKGVDKQKQEGTELEAPQLNRAQVMDAFAKDKKEVAPPVEVPNSNRAQIMASFGNGFGR